MAAVTTRQPFAPLNEARLHTLTSLKNRQNAISSPSPVKRKASDVAESDNSENVDPVLFSKRAKGTDGFFPSKDSFIKPSAFFLTNPVFTPFRARWATADPPSAPAVFVRLGGAPEVPLLGDVAPKKSSSGLSDFNGLHEPEMKSSWFFDIHEDTVIEDMTNALDHKASGLEIMSEEEKRKKLQEEYEESKENHPPIDDISQTSQPRAARPVNADEMVFEKERNPLGEMDPKDYYSQGCDENSIIIVPGDEDEEAPVQNDRQFIPEVNSSVAIADQTEVDLIAESEPLEEERCASAEELMQKTDHPAPSAAVLEPLEGTGESFEDDDDFNGSGQNVIHVDIRGEAVGLAGVLAFTAVSMTELARIIRFELEFSQQ
ncbi:hypothetical protein CIB48_g8539 [Xylaria polymorpha]|nr:hypothetical protein CIB48_g8539 [Xylaria polymorpha]